MHSETSKCKQSVLTVVHQFLQLALETIILYITLTMILCHTRIWNRLNTFCFIRCAYFLTWCAHANTNMKLSLIILLNTWSCWRIHHFTNPDSTRFFMTKPIRPGRLKNRSGWKKTQWERLSHAAKRKLPVLLHSWNEGMWNATQSRWAFRGLRVI